MPKKLNSAYLAAFGGTYAGAVSGTESGSRPNPRKHYKPEDVLLVFFEDGVQWAPNPTSCAQLIEQLGPDASTWVGCHVEVTGTRKTVPTKDNPRAMKWCVFTVTATRPAGANGDDHY